MRTLNLGTIKGFTQFLAKLMTIKRGALPKIRQQETEWTGSMSNIKGIIFDFGEVISQPQDDNCLIKMVELLHLKDQADFYTVYRGYRNDYDRGISGSDYWTGIANHYGLEADAGIITALIEQDILSWTRVKPEMVAFIASLKTQGYRLALLSNMPAEIGDYLNHKADWLRFFDHTVFSSDLKLIKPDAAIYRHCLARMGLKPEECLFIDDMERNVAAARNCGIAAIHFQSFPQLLKEIKEILE
jgi:putative hydrolase of the HAD superfamily